MHDKESDWTLDQHMSAGVSALARISQVCAGETVQPVCFHFSELVPIDQMIESRSEKFEGLIPLFSELGLDFLADRLEAWEQTIPNMDWLASRVPALYQIAANNGLRFQGWSWEPRGNAPIGALGSGPINGIHSGIEM